VPRELALGVLADDLTGALASAARLAEGGWRPRVVWKETAPAAAERAVVVDMRTRDYGVDPCRLARSWARHLEALGCAWIELRIDSTLRGQPAAELAGVRSVMRQERRVLAVPAFPEAGRTVVGGRLRAPVALPGGDDDVARVLLGGAGRAATVPAELVDDGAEAVAGAIMASDADCVVADGTCEAHLRTLAQAARLVTQRGHALLSVSPGAWLRYWPAPPPAPFVLVVLSSATASNRRQLTELARRRPVVVLAARDVVGAGLGDALAGEADTVVVETISHDVVDPATAWLQSSLAARAAGTVLTEALVAGATCGGLVVGGGQTASAVMDVLGAGHLLPSGELAPLCPVARVAEGTWAGLPVVTKGGLVGERDTLAQLVDALWKELT
jgi:uncharacterized protein YgbK (DUF1537 family)